MVLFYLCCSFAFHNTFAQDDYSIRTFREVDSLAQNYVNSIIQDSRGFLWVGTGKGLSRYDGKSIVNFRKTNGLADNFITTSTADEKGKLYYGHLNGSISVYTGFGFDIIESGETAKIVALDFDATTKTVWGICQNGKLFNIYQNKITFLSPQTTQDKIISCLKVTNGRLLIGSDEGLIWITLGENNAIESEGKVEALDYINITSLSKSKNLDLVWASTEENGIYKIRNGEAQSLSMEGLDTLHITQLLEDDQDNLWIGTKLSGLLKFSFDDNMENLLGHVFFTGPNSLQSPSILFEDAEKNIWAGSLGEGLAQYIPNQFTFYDLHQLTGAEEAGPGLQISKTEYWIGTEKGIVQGRYNITEKRLFWKLHPDKTVRQILAITMFREQDDSLIWIGDRAQNVLVYNLNTGDLNTINELEKGALNYAVRKSNGNTLLAIEGHGVYQLDNRLKKQNQFNTTNGLLHNSISSLCVDQNQNIWYGSNATGLFRQLPNGEFEYWTKDGLFPSNSVNDITEDRLRNIWVATDGEGLFKIGQDSMFNFTVSNGLVSNFCKKLISDSIGNIWTSHRLGLSKLSTKNKNAIRAFGSANKLNSLSEENNTFFEDESGNVWLSEGSRVIRYNTQLDDSNYFNRIAHFTNVRLFYKNLELLAYKKDDSEMSFDLFPVELPFDQNHVTIDFVAVSLRNQNSVFYRHQLVGYEKEWSPYSQETYTTYTNLEPGHYSLLVSTSSNTFTWSDEGSRYDFVIAKPYWQRWWFYTSETLMLVILFLITFLLSQRDDNKNKWIVRWLIYIFIFVIFDFILVNVEPYFDGINNGAPVFKVIINLCLALVLLPIENFIKEIMTKKVI